MPGTPPPSHRIHLPGTVISKEEEIPPGLQNIENKALEGYVRRKGVVFAKTDFQGVLKTSYVRLHFEGQGKGTRSFDLDIEGKTDGNSLIWNGKTVKPGYFFIELPVGGYRISSIAIPVGSTLAEEAINVRFEVIPGAIVYLGTLKVQGTKERIKLGGVPVIKPGFDYDVQVLDERAEGILAFHQRYPGIPAVIETRLMRISR
ncbi:MAG: hypothetical protein HZA29_05780 [Candidatus Omnitrophica bacterium]|nr:hypothetical protein [Candidatus Omnitrophota bacterium]